MVNVKFINATSVQLVDQNGNTVSNVGEFISPTEFLLNANTFSQDAEHYYHFAITGSDVQLSGVIDSVTTKHQFRNLFAGCTAITDANLLQLTASNITEGCYSNMFLDCKKLTTPPSTLPATTLAFWCYQGMFGNCSSLSTAPTLPATELAKYCYYAMFYGCKSLKNSPTLPATTLTDWCYNSMFYNCTSLSSITCNFSSWTPSNATSNWVKGIETVGEFNNENISEIYGDDNIPVNWQDLNLTAPLSFKSVGNSNVALSSVHVYGLTSKEYPISLQYSKNGGTWTNYNIGAVINLSNNLIVAFSGNNIKFSYDLANYYKFVMTGSVTASGNILSLVNWNRNLSSNNTKFEYLFVGCSALTTPPVVPAKDLTNYCYWGMFKGCSNLVTAPKVLPATTLAYLCYRDMFSGCTSLTAAPKLPASSLVTECYLSMFQDCTSLTVAPQLSATSLDNYCYAAMFMGCTSLTAAPTLPATILDTGCYASMFKNCTALSTAPYLPAMNQADNCYANMFDGCTHLNLLSVNFTQWRRTSDSINTFHWVYNVAANGTFYKPTTLSTAYGEDYIPAGWTVIDK